jgi:replicative DNA helicase
MNNSKRQLAPWSREAEQAVLGALLMDGRAIAKVPALGAADFYEGRHGLAFSAIASLVARGEAADQISVFLHLQSAGQADEAGGLAYLTELAQCVASVANIERHAAVVQEHARRRALLAALDGAITRAKAPGTVADALDSAQAELSALARGQLERAPQSLAEVALRRTAYYESLESGEVQPGWSTGIDRLDALLNGGLRPGGLYVIAARPAVGKSSLALQLAVNTAQTGLPTVFLSQEMSSEEVADRAVVHVGRVAYSSLLNGRLGADGWERATDALEALSALPLNVDDQPALTLGAIRGKARAVRGLRVLVLDYLQLCAGSPGAANRNAEIEELSRGLKALAKGMGCAVVALSQLNRAVETRASRRPTLADLRDSGAIEQDADVVAFLWPVADGTPKLVGVEVAKNRQGATGAFGLDFDGSMQRWSTSRRSVELAAAPRQRAPEL